MDSGDGGSRKLVMTPEPLLMPFTDKGKEVSAGVDSGVDTGNETGRAAGVKWGTALQLVLVASELLSLAA